MSTQIEMLEIDEPVRPLYQPDFGDTLETAANVFRLSVPTLRRKVKEHRIFHRSATNATIRFELAALSMILSEDWRALELWRGGERDDERVARHYRHVEGLVTAWLDGEREKERLARG